jgi:uncharacterized protein involved in exopolysaccharide biosynthesis
LQLTSGSSLSDRDAGQLRAYLDDLQAQIRTRSNYDQGRIATMSPEILQLQGQIQQVKNEEDRLTLQRDIAKQSYQSLVQETEGLGIAGHGVDGGIVVASPAIPPTLPVSAHLATTLAQAGAIGLLLGLSIVGLEEWWRRGSKASALSSALPSVPGPSLASANGAPEQASLEGSKAI